MRHSFYRIPIAFLLVLNILSCGLISKNPASGENTVLPEMELIAADGSRVKLSSLKGKKLFVNLWATWCGPCVAEMPSIQKLYAKTNRSQSEFVLISFDSEFETAKQWASGKQLNLPVFGVSGELPELFKVDGIPSTFIFNENGHLVFQQTGSDNYDTDKFVRMLSGTQ